MNQSKPYVFSGQITGQGSYKAQTEYKQTGPRVAGQQRYDQYGNGGNQGYKDEHHMSGCEKCCACLGATICCCCVLDCLT